MAGAEDLRRVERHQAEQGPAGDRPEETRRDGQTERALDQSRRAHRPDAERRRHEAEADQGAVMREAEGRDVGDADHVGRADDRLGGERSDERSGEHRPRDRERIGADDQLEGVEGPGQRRIEGGGDRPARAAADQHAQVMAP